MQKIKILTLIFLAAFLYLFRLGSLPPGLETDEGSIGYSASLVAKNLHDQNNRLLPVFVLSENLDYKQPVTMYLTAIYFKLFGTSITTFKLVNVSVTLLTITILYFALKAHFKTDIALLGILIYMLSPIIIMSTRISNESIMPSLFSAIWIFSLVKYHQAKNLKYLVLTAISIGLGFYSYKGMRLITPIWTLLSLIFISWINKLSLTKHLAVFILSLLPFLIIIPFLEYKYPGSIYDRNNLHVESYRHYAKYWFSNLSFNLFFTQGDPDIAYNYDLFGLVLLSTMPMFLLGIKKSIYKTNFNTFILLSFVFTPLLFGMAGSYDVGHRLVAIIPLYIYIVCVGIEVLYINHKLKFLNAVLILFFILNSSEFIYKYFRKYPTLDSVQVRFGNNLNQGFYELANLSNAHSLTPYVQKEIYLTHGEGNKFFESIYFSSNLKYWDNKDPIPPRSIILTRLDGPKNIKKIKVDKSEINLLLNQSDNSL